MPTTRSEVFVAGTMTPYYPVPEDDRGLKVIYDCGHETRVWREAGVSDHYTCSCIACHPNPVHKSPFKCKECDPKTIGSLWIIHAPGGMLCCRSEEGLKYEVQMDLRKRGFLPWHKAVPSTWTWSWGPRKGQKAYGLRVDCYKKSSSFSLEAGQPKVCISCKEPIEDRAMELPCDKNQDAPNADTQKSVTPSDSAAQQEPLKTGEAKATGTRTTTGRSRKKKSS